MSQLFALVFPGIQRSKKAMISRRADVKKASIELKMRHGCMGKWESGSWLWGGLNSSCVICCKRQGNKGRLVNFKPKRPMRKFGILFNPLNPCRSWRIYLPKSCIINVFKNLLSRRLVSFDSKSYSLSTSHNFLWTMDVIYYDDIRIQRLWWRRILALNKPFKS